MRFMYCLLALLLSASAAFATHILGGYVRAVPAAGQALTCQITVVMYYDGGSAAQAATTLNVCFGENGTTRQVARTGSRPLPAYQGINPNISVNEYTTTYTYSGPGVYSIQATTIGRNTTIRNISGGGALQAAFSLRTTLQVGGALQNQTPTFTLPPAGLVVSLNQRVSLALGATDADGDSLAYALSLPLTSLLPEETTGLCTSFSAINGYQFPNDVTRRGTYRLNAKTGLLNWDVPTEQGQYEAAVLVSEWRNGSLISQTQHDVLIVVIDRGGTPVSAPAYEPAQTGLITALPDADQEGMVLRVSPNPVVGGSVQADLLISHAQAVTMELLDGQGRVYNIVRFDQPSRQHQMLFDLAGKPAGLYLIRAKSGGQQVVRKVLKQ